MRVACSGWAGTSDHVHPAGVHFKVDGRIRKPVPETLPLLVSAASSERGRAFAAKHCDYLFATPLDARDIVDLGNDLQKQPAGRGRPYPPDILVLSYVFIRDEPGRAREEYEALVNSSDPEAQRIWKSH